MNKRYIRSIVLLMLIILADQLLKIYIKTNFTLGESRTILGHWFQLHFIENNGMAFGLEVMKGPAGKIFLSLFRLVAVAFGLVYLFRIAKAKEVNNIFLACIVLIIAGAAGNLIDSMFYGCYFTQSTYHTVSHFTQFGHGYAPFFQGMVVDMLYFPLIEFNWPDWMPFIGGDHFLFFAPIFNIADFSISLGAIMLLVFQRKLFKA